RREIHYAEVGMREAEADFEAMMKGGVVQPLGFRAMKERVFRRLEDHMFHEVARLAAEYRLPFQIHTGLLAGNSCFIENLNPRHLTNLFYLFPNVKFDLFHIGYPYQQELGVLAKLFPNVFIDFCWAHVISPPGARAALDEYLETVPVNKILGFGGDYRFPEMTYGHSRVARANVARVLAGKVAAKLMSEDQAAAVGKQLLWENGLSLFPPPRQ
ncbi:MAG: amidohydrolase, partial [Bryobacter sp.]|nr:amidohydrolase [Bryobacter sp.]